MIKKKRKPGSGGPRPGSGPKPFLENPSKHLVNLDEKTIVTLTALGGGNLSAGIRKAAEVVSRKESL